MIRGINGLEWLLRILVPILVNVAFLTLLERKLLSFRQARVGPNKVGGYGLLQPFADVVKLFGKGFTLISIVVPRLFLLAPFLRLVLALLFPIVLGLKERGVIWEYSVLYLLIVLRLNIYPLLLAGWSSNRKYALVGGLRGVSQTISYEIRLAFLALRLFIEIGKFRLGSTSVALRLIWSYPLLILWFLSCVAELNRTPFDFAEGESELVSGFNIEFGSVKFALIFIAEYAIILSLSLLSASLLVSNQSLRIEMVCLGVIIARLVISFRATYPRYRYDLLIELAWKRLLPWRLGLVELTLCFNVWSA